MSRLSFLAIPLALILAIALSGCGSGAKTGAAKTVTPTAYANALCSAVGPFEAEIARRADALDPARITSPAAGRSALEGFLGGLESDSRTAARRLTAAGTPQVPDGKRIAAALAGVFRRLESTLAQAVTQTKALPTASVAAFRSAEKSIGSAVERSLGNLSAGIGGVKSAALEQAGKKAPACRSLG